MFKRSKYTEKEAKELSLLYLIVGILLLVGNFIAFLIQGASITIYLSSFTGIMFALTGWISRVRGVKNKKA